MESTGKRPFLRPRSIDFKKGSPGNRVARLSISSNEKAHLPGYPDEYCT